jgi:outer membrane immunogenic protein
MKKFLLASTALVLFTGVSYAADMPAVEPEPIAEFDWTGAYIGLQVGFARKDHDNRHDNRHEGWEDGNWGHMSFDGFDDGFDGGKDGINGGGQIGYLFQTGSFVFGIEGAFLAADFEDIFDNDFEDSIDGSHRNEFRHNIDFIATVSGRIGWAAWDRALLYAKGGWAGADLNVEFNDRFEGVDDEVGHDFNDDDGDFISGFNVGGGIDYAITDNFIIGAEYTFMKFDDADFSFDDVVGDRHDFDSELEIQTINFKASYRF